MADVRRCSSDKALFPLEAEQQQLRQLQQLDLFLSIILEIYEEDLKVRR